MDVLDNMKTPLNPGRFQGIKHPGNGMLFCFQVNQPFAVITADIP